MLLFNLTREIFFKNDLFFQRSFLPTIEMTKFIMKTLIYTGKRSIPNFSI